MSKTGGQDTFSQATKPTTTTSADHKLKAKKFSEALQARMQQKTLTNEEELEKKVQREAEILKIQCTQQKHKLKKFL